MNDRGLVSEIKELALLSSDILQDDRLISSQLSLLQNIRLLCPEADPDALEDVPYNHSDDFLAELSFYFYNVHRFVLDVINDADNVDSVGLGYFGLMIPSLIVLLVFLTLLLAGHF